MKKKIANQIILLGSLCIFGSMLFSADPSPKDLDEEISDEFEFEESNPEDFGDENISANHATSHPAVDNYLNELSNLATNTVAIISKKNNKSDFLSKCYQSKAFLLIASKEVESLSSTNPCKQDLQNFFAQKLLVMSKIISEIPSMPENQIFDSANLEKIETQFFSSDNAISFFSTRLLDDKQLVDLRELISFQSLLCDTKAGKLFFENTPSFFWETEKLLKQLRLTLIKKLYLIPDLSEDNLKKLNRLSTFTAIDGFAEYFIGLSDEFDLVLTQNKNSFVSDSFEALSVFSKNLSAKNSSILEAKQNAYLFSDGILFNSMKDCFKESFILKKKLISNELFLPDEVEAKILSILDDLVFSKSAELKMAAQDLKKETSQRANEFDLKVLESSSPQTSKIIMSTHPQDEIINLPNKQMPLSTLNIPANMTAVTMIPSNISSKIISPTQDEFFDEGEDYLEDDLEDKEILEPIKQATKTLEIKQPFQVQSIVSPEASSATPQANPIIVQNTTSIEDEEPDNFEDDFIDEAESEDLINPPKLTTITAPIMVKSDPINIIPQQSQPKIGQNTAITTSIPSIQKTAQTNNEKLEEPEEEFEEEEFEEEAEPIVQIKKEEPLSMVPNIDIPKELEKTVLQQDKTVTQANNIVPEIIAKEDIEEDLPEEFDEEESDDQDIPKEETKKADIKTQEFKTWPWIDTKQSEEQKPEIKSETKAEAKPELKLEVKPELKPVTQPEPKPSFIEKIKDKIDDFKNRKEPELTKQEEAKPKPKLEVKPESKPVTQPEPKPSFIEKIKDKIDDFKNRKEPELTKQEEAKPEPKLEVKPESKPVTQPEPKPSFIEKIKDKIDDFKNRKEPELTKQEESKPEPKLEVKPELKPLTQPEPKPSFIEKVKDKIDDFKNRKELELPKQEEAKPELKLEVKPDIKPDENQEEAKLEPKLEIKPEAKISKKEVIEEKINDKKNKIKGFFQKKRAELKEAIS